MTTPALLARMRILCRRPYWDNDDGRGAAYWGITADHELLRPL
jgi:hypothetical protein